MNAHFNYFIRSATDWLFRRRSPALHLVRAGVVLILLLVGGWAVSASIPTQYGPFTVSFDSEGGTPALISYCVFALAIGLIFFGFVWYRADQKRLARKKVIVVETRGLRDTSGTPLVEAVPHTMDGQRDQVLVDLRQRLRDGVIIDPNAAVERLVSLPADLERRELGLDRRDITYIYGGLAPVPLTFLTGVLMDDEGSISVMDWDRHSGNWRVLDGADDGKRFKITGLSAVPPHSADVALAVSVSYGVDLISLRTRTRDIPLIQMELEEGAPDCHWSADKQAALGKQFLETAVVLGNRAVQRIHLFLAAPNSVVFRFGRLYDKRNLPELIVYQYERDRTPPHCWGIHMPVAGIPAPQIVR